MGYELEQLDNGYRLEWEGDEEEMGQLEDWLQDQGFGHLDDNGDHIYLRHPAGAEARVAEDHAQIDLYIDEEPDEFIITGIQGQRPIDIGAVLGEEDSILDLEFEPIVDVTDQYTPEEPTHTPAKE